MTDLRALLDAVNEGTTDKAWLPKGAPTEMWFQNAAGDLLRLTDLLDIAEAARATGWNEIGGKCWCPESPEMADGSMRSHTERCGRLRNALTALDRHLEGEK